MQQRIKEKAGRDQTSNCVDGADLTGIGADSVPRSTAQTAWSRGLVLHQGHLCIGEVSTWSQLKKMVTKAKQMLEQ